MTSRKLTFTSVATAILAALSLCAVMYYRASQDAEEQRAQARSHCVRIGYELRIYRDSLTANPQSVSDAPSIIKSIIREAVGFCMISAGNDPEVVAKQMFEWALIAGTPGQEVTGIEKAIEHLRVSGY